MAKLKITMADGAKMALDKLIEKAGSERVRSVLAGA